MEPIKDVDPTLLWLLRRAGDEWGPLGVAKVAARMAGHHVEQGLENDRAPAWAIEMDSAITSLT